MSTAIEFNHVSKQYRLGLVSTKTLSHDIRRFWITNVLGKEDPYLKIGETNDRASKGTSDYVWALRDIDFKVEQGDVVGIIGKNGAGKSTLLKLLSRVTGPTTGTIRAHGRIGSLLEVGTGFHQEMTGRENIYLNGAILGMTRREIDRKLDEIIDFSGCERYIDTPVKRYSSGMTVRLGFAVAAFLEPEILVVDEVLAVGDAEFQKKAIGKMKDVSTGEGRTVLFVSHNMDSVLNLCNHGVLLENGMVKQIGKIKPIVESYLMGSDQRVEYKAELSNKRVFISYAGFTGSDAQKKGLFNFNDHIGVRIRVDKSSSLVKFDKNMVLSVTVITSKGTQVCTNEISLAELQSKDSMEVVLNYPSEIIRPGGYYIRGDVHVPNVEWLDGHDLCNLTISDVGSEFIKYGGNDNGVVFLKPELELI